jgi:hypothetical protein
MMHSVQNQVPGLVLVGKVWIRNQLSLNVFLKTLVLTRLTRIRVSPRHCGTGMYFKNFQSRVRRGGFPFGGVIVHHEGIISESFNKMVIFQERTRVYVSFFREFTLDGIPFSKVKRKKIRTCC